MHFKNVITRLEAIFYLTFKGANTLIAGNQHPEIDGTTLCLYTDATRFRSIIISFNCLITLERFQSNYATISLGRFNMASREGHLKFAIYILYYAKKFDKIRIIFNTLNQDHFKYFTETYDKWREFYPDAQEEISHGMSNIKVKYI